MTWWRWSENSDFRSDLFTGGGARPILAFMWAFVRRQTFYFICGFTVSLAAIVAWKVGVSDLVDYAIVSAVVGLVVSVGIFFLERIFPDNTAKKEE